MRLSLIALLALGACSSQPQPAAPVNAIQAEETNITTDASPAPLDKRPAKSAKATTARFRCMDGVRIVARFDPEGSAVLTRAGTSVTLQQQVMASGIRYSDGKVTFQGKGDNMSYEAPGQPPIACTAIRG
jgi:membrane-bound inhibitor of C-type lysozyme